MVLVTSCIVCLLKGKIRKIYAFNLVKKGYFMTNTNLITKYIKQDGSIIHVMDALFAEVCLTERELEMV